MRRESVRRVADKVMRLCGGVISDPNGLIVRRVFAGGGYQTWRLRCGSGIAGNGGLWWLEPISVENGGAREKTRGPFRNVRELERELRRWRRWEDEDRLGARGAFGNG